jgi:iron complex transport system permease protein
MKLDKKYLIITLGVIALVLLLGIFSTVGTVNLELKEIISALINNDNKIVTTIVYKMRLPRNILAAIVGANLAVA